MIIGSCPYCDETIICNCEDIPGFCNGKCEKCGKLSWLKRSRFEPIRYTNEEFNRLFEIKGDTVVERTKENPR